MTEAPAAPLKVCVVVGLGGGGIGDKVAEKWSAEGYAVALLARRKENLAEIAAAIPNSKAYECDASVSEQVYAVVALITEEMGPIDTLIYNVGSGTFKPFEAITEEDMQRSFSAGPMGLFSFAKAVSPGMTERGRGVIGVTGATASWRGMPFTPAFAPAKFAVRALCQSLARSLSPKGVHVFHVIIDGGVLGGAQRAAIAAGTLAKPETDFLHPEAIAETYWAMASQSPGAWSFETNVVAADRMFDMLTI